MIFDLEITDKEYNQISRIVEEAAGIKLGSNKKELVKNRLRKRLSSLSLTSFGDYLKYLKEGDDARQELSRMVTVISTNVTYFFREEDHFHFLKDRVLPEIYREKERHGVKKIRCWSAGCSSGEEPYSLAITINDYLNGNLNSMDIKILATDVSTHVLEKAVKGMYKIAALENVPPHLIKRNFYRGVNNREGFAMVKEHLKNMVLVRFLNLMEKNYPFKGPFDFIFCRNVMIYFDKSTQRELLCKFHERLEPGGYLFLGHSEGLTGTHSGFKYVAPAVYVKQ